MRYLLRTLANNATVVVDAPPLLPVTDAAVLTAVADGAFVVISAGRSIDHDLEAALSQLNAAHGHTLGVIFNRVAKRGQDAGYYRSNYYSTEEPQRRIEGGAHSTRSDDDDENGRGRRRAS
jgi:Mrp family chromosome partitioning ATPase